MEQENIAIKSNSDAQLYIMPIHHYLFKFTGRINRINYFLMRLATSFVSIFIWFIFASVFIFPNSMDLITALKADIGNIIDFESYAPHSFYTALGNDFLMHFQQLTPAMYIIVILTLLISIPILWVDIHLNIQRLHDFNMAGWIAIIAVVASFFFPLLGLIFFMFLLFMPGTKGANKYGKIAGMFEQ